MTNKNTNPVSEIEEISIEANDIVARLLHYGWKAGKKQLKNPYQYTLPDIEELVGKKEWKKIMNLLHQSRQQERERCIKALEGYQLYCPDCAGSGCRECNGSGVIDYVNITDAIAKLREGEND